MIGLDCNILVQLALADHPANPATVAAMQTSARRGERFILPSLIATEFLHVVTEGRRFDPPLTMIEALEWLEDFMANPAVCLLEPAPEVLRQTMRWMRQFNLGRKRILDTHLASMLCAAGVTRLLTANPGDFKIFGVLEPITP
jgi:predicted nucleic acid-binding protein